jgi:hypothetical protein
MIVISQARDKLPPPSRLIPHSPLVEILQRVTSSCLSLSLFPFVFFFFF